MPRIYFHLVKGRERIDDAQGIELEDSEFIAISWSELLTEIAREEPILFYDRADWLFEISDAQGQVISSVPIATLQLA